METAAAPSNTRKGTRLLLFFGGLAAIVLGILVLVWPGHTAVALTAIIAIYAVISGVVYVIIGIFSKALGAGGRIAHILLGLLYIAAGAYAFSSLARTSVFLFLFLTIMVGVMWMMEGFAALFAMGKTESKFLTAVFAILSIVAGFVLLSSPIWGALFLWWFLGAAMIVLGFLNIVRGLVGKKD